MATRIAVSVAKGRLINEPPFFLLREIIDVYNALAIADAKQSGALVRRLFKLVFGWRWPLVYCRLSALDLAEFLRHLPSDLGLDANTEATHTSQDPWGDVYAHLSMTFGWTYDDIDQRMTLSKVKALNPYLRAHPPTHLLVAAYLNYQPTVPLEEKRRRFFDRFTGGKA